MFEPIANLTAQYEYWPGCDYSVYTPNFDIIVVEGDSWDAHTMTLKSHVKAETGNYCPDFNSEVIFYRNGARMMSIALTQDETDTFYVNGPDYDGSRIMKEQKQSFNDGTYCTEYQITPVAAQPGQEPVTLTSHQACYDITAPAC